MHQINLKEAETQLAKLIEAAASGEEVVITRSDGASFKIVPINLSKPRPKFGSAKGLTGLKQISTPNKAQSSFISDEYVPILIELLHKTERHCCPKGI